MSDNLETIAVFFIGWGIVLCVIALTAVVYYMIVQWMVNRAVNKRIEEIKKGIYPG